jgi:hypothetical protein
VHSIIIMYKVERLTEGSALDLKRAFCFSHNYSSKCFCSAEHLLTEGRGVSTMHAGVYGKCPLVLFHFKQNWNE